ncbi:MAG: hypothetical protein DCC67_12005 [Planctomycetota bacterium]|nr:MAG: hypothetical protein DCC67_12005 [Planctomycetota bacterium]
MKAARTHVIEVARKHGWRVQGEISKRLYRCVVLADAGTEGEYLPIDLLGGFEYRGRQFADATYGLNSRKRTTSGVWTVSLGFEAATTALKELIPHGRLKEDSRSRVQQGAIQEPDDFCRAISSCVGETLANHLQAACADGNWMALEALAVAVRDGISKVGVRPLMRRIDSSVRSARHLFAKPVSAFVVFVGPDGAGKTTIAKSLCDSLLKKPFKDVKYLRTRFGVLPELKSLKRLAAKAVGQQYVAPEVAAPGTANSGMIQPLSAIRGAAYACYYALDQAVGRLPLRLMRGRWNLIVFDRYFYDYYYQLGYRTTPKWLLACLERVVPRPDLILYIDRDAQEIHAAKPELTTEEIQRQQTHILKHFSKRSQFRAINGRHGVDATCAEAVRIVSEFVSSTAVPARD